MKVIIVISVVQEYFKDGNYTPHINVDFMKVRNSIQVGSMKVELVSSDLPPAYTLKDYSMFGTFNTILNEIRRI